MDLLKLEGKVNTLDKDLDRIANLRTRAECLKLEVGKLLNVYTELMTQTKTAYVQKSLKAKRHG